jgi:sec-independent protein translocase protein TatA
MFGIGVPELAIILVIVLVIFGAGKLPEIGAGIGRGIKNFKTSIAEKEDKPQQLDQGKAS